MKTILFLLALMLPVQAWALDYVAGDVVPITFGANSDTGQRDDPTSNTVGVVITDEATGTQTFTALSTAVQKNTTTGLWGTTYTVPGSPVIGTYEAWVYAAVATGKEPISVVSRWKVVAAGGGGLTQQQVADAMLLAPVGSVIAGSQVAKMDAVVTNTGTTIPAQITGLNDVAATDIVSAGAITTLSGAVVNVDLVDVTTTNTDQRGTDGANTVAPLSAAQVRTEVDAGHSAAIPGISESINQKVRRLP